jgi:hypothetical protein
MTRSSRVIASVAAGVVVVLLVGAWLLFGERETAPAGTTAADVAATTELSWPPDPSDGSRPPDPYPTVPSARVRSADTRLVRTAADGRRLLVQLSESDCSSEEARLLGEHPDRVEVEIRLVLRPPSSSAGAVGGYVCGGIMVSDGPYAVIDLREPLEGRAVLVRREP